MMHGMEPLVLELLVFMLAVVGCALAGYVLTKWDKLWDEYAAVVKRQKETEKQFEEMAWEEQATRKQKR